MTNRVTEYLGIEGLVEKAFAISASEFRYRAVGMLPIAIFGETVLDVGCGPGSLVDGIKRMGARPVCVDIDPQMTEWVSATYGVPAIEADALDLPFADRVFSGVMCSGLLHSVPDKVALFNELYRVTKWGGRIVIANKGIAPWLRHTEWYRAAVEALTPPSADPPPVDLLPVDATDVQLCWSDPPILYALAFTVGGPGAI